MATPTVHVLHGIQTPTQFYGQVESSTPSPQLQELLATAGNYTQPLFLGVRGAQPQVSFRTPQLATLLAEAGLFGADLTAGNVDVYYRKAVNRGTLIAAATTSHTRLRIAKAMMYLRQISAGHQREAIGDATILATYDGTNAPIVPAGSLALAGTATSAEHFCLGPVSINGSAIDGIDDCTIDLQPTLRTRGDASQPYPTFNGVRSIAPVITLRGAALEPWVNYGLNGIALSALIVYLRKVNTDVGSGNMYVLDATAQHIKFTAANGIVHVPQASGGDGSDATTEVKILLRSADSSTACMTVATASAIT